jgi:two-component system CheB/CheR fusion protein
MNGKIYVNLVHNNKFTDIQIRDTGVGLTEKEKELLFEKFGKIERYGMDLGVDIEGSGLGLYISKEIVELHGGQILVESEGRNKGTIFTVRLFWNDSLL